MDNVSDNRNLSKCPLCHGDDYEELFSCKDADRISDVVFGVVRCRKCRLVRTDPIPDDDALIRWYRPGYHGWWRTRKRHPFSILIRFFHLNRSRWIPKRLCKGKLADIGCGDGSFASFMSGRGWKALGIEISGRHTHIKEASVPEIYVVGGESKGRFLDTFDAVTLWHVLEHVEDPVDTLRNAYNMLKPGGILVLSIPNFESAQASVCRGRWFHLDVPRHRWHFEWGTIIYAMRKSGFRPIRLSSFSLEYNPFGWWQSLLNAAGCSHNFAYNLLKRRELSRCETMSVATWNLTCSAVLGVIFLPVAFVLAIVEAMAGRGGTIVVTAAREP